MGTCRFHGKVMNRIYKVIFNRSLGLYQVVSEIARNHGKSSSPAGRGRKSLLVPFVLSALLGLGLTGSALAEDTGTTVANAAVTMKDGDQMQMKGTGAASVSSSSTTDESGKTTTTITVEVPTNGEVAEKNTGLVTGGTVYTAVNAALSNQIGTLNTDGNYIKKDGSVSTNLSTLDTQVKANVDAISKEKTDREAAVTAAVTNVTNTVSTLSDSVVKYDTGLNNGKVTLAGEGGTTITNVKDGAVSGSSTDAVTGKQLYAEQTARTGADTDLSNRIGTLDTDGTYIKKGASVSSNLSTLDTHIQTNDSNIKALQTSTTNSLATKADVNASNLASLSDEELTAWGSALGKNGSISQNSSRLITGGTIYNELTPTGTVYYIGSAGTTAARLTTLDNTLKTFADQLGVDLSSNTNLANQLYKYYKVNPEITTNADTTKTYAPDAAANGTNSVAIGPSAQAGDKSTDATTSTTTITGGKSSTAIGDSAKANGDQSVALGYGSEVLNASGSTTAVSGSTAIGSSAKVEGGSDSTALGSGASVDTASGAMALGKGATINKTAASGVAIGNGAVTGSADQTITVNQLSYNVNAAGGVDSVAIGTDASNAGNTSLALGKGATVENDSDGNYQAVVKSDDIAIGTDAKTSASDFSTAIGKGASVTQSTDALAVGSGAKVTTSKNAMAFGKGADAENAADSIAMGTSAKTISADTIAIGQNTSAEGANSVVIGKGAATTDEGGNAIGSSSTASGRSTAIGQSATANNFDALAIGNGATANVDRSISLGYNAGVGTSEVKGEPQNAGSLIAIGTSAGNNVSGMQNVAIGESAGSNVKSSYNIAIGTQAGYGINYASDNKVQNGYNVSIGYKANYQENVANIMYATALGNEANASNYAVAIGDGAKASGTNSLALGYSAQASDAESMALGHNASAADGNVAIGNGSLAPSVSTLGKVKAVTVDGKTINYVYDANGNPFKSAFTYKPLQADSHYISVGNSTLTRRISNVADGVFDSDAATVGQLNSLNELLQATNTKVGLTTAYFDQKFTNLNTTIDASKTHYFSISESSDNLSANKDNTGATSNKADAMAIGPNANATNVKSLAVGNNVYATGLRSIAIGTAPNPTKDAAGTTTTHNTSADGENSIALGTSTTAQADNSIAIGTRAQTYTTDTTSKTGAGSVAIGNLATTAGNQSVALGYDATVKYDYGTAIGSEALASGTDAVAVGKGSKAYSTDSTAIGQNNTVTGSNVYGLGSSNAISGNWGSIVQSGVSGYKNTVTSVSDQDTTNALTGVYMTGSSNTLNQNVKYNVMQDITVQGSSNTIDGGAGGTSGHPNTLSQIAIVGSDNTVQGKSSDDSKTNNIKDVTILGYNNKVDANTDTTVDFSNTQILGSNVTAKLGNSVYLGSNAAYTSQTPAASDTITSARTAADAAAEASDAYKAATTDTEKAQIKAQYEAQYLYKLNVQAMEASGTTAGTQSYSTDETYGDGTSYTYAGSSPAGVVTVGSVGAERRIQNVAAGLVSASSTDAVNGSQLYALTRQIRFGGDNSTFGKTTAADDVNVVAKGSNEKLAITGGAEGVSNTTTTDGKSVTTVDGTKIADKNIAVIAEDDALHVKLASNLKNLNTAQLGKTTATTTTTDDGTSTTTYSYQETLKLDGTGDNGGTLALKDAKGENGVTLRTSGATKTADVTGAETNRLLVNDKTVATTDDGLKFGGDTGTDSVLKLNNKLTVKGGTTDTSKLTDNNIGVVSDGSTGTLTVKLNKDVNLGTDGSLTTGTVTAATVTTGSSTLNTNGLTITGGPKFTSNGISANSQQIKNVLAGTDDTDAANYSQIKKATTTLTTGKNGNVNVTSDSTSADGHTNYTIAVDNLAVKANGTGNTTVALANGINFKNGTNTTSAVDNNGNVTIDTKNLTLEANGTNKASVSMDGGINFKNGTNTTAIVDTDGTVTISATHNKLDSASYTASNPSDSSNKTTLNLKDTDGNETTLNLTDTYTTVSKNGTDHTVTFARNDGVTNTLSLGDLNGASKDDLNSSVTTLNSTIQTAVAKATSTVVEGDNVASVTDDTTSADGHHIYTVNVDNLAVKVNSTQKSVQLKDGLVFGNGTNTTATLSDDGTITYNVSNAAIKTQAKDAINLTAGSNVTVDTATSADGTTKTFTVKATHNKLTSATAATGDQDNVTLTLKDADGNEVTSTGLKNTYSTGGNVTYAASGEGTATVTRNDGNTYTITGLKDTKVSSGKADYTGATGTATLTMNDGTTATITGLQNDYVTTATVTSTGTNKNHVTLTRLGGGTVDVNLNPILDNYSLSDYQLVGNGDTQDQAYTVGSDGTVTLNVVDSKNAANKKTIQITGLASQSGVTAGRTTVQSSDSSVKVTDSTANGDTHTYDIQVDYAKIPANLKVQYSGDNGTTGSNTMDTATAFNGTAGQIETTAENGKVTFKLANDITGINSVTTGNAKLDTNGLTIQENGANKVAITSSKVNLGGNVVSNIGAATVNTDAATLGQVKSARTAVAAGSNVSSVAEAEATDGSNQKTYTVNVDNLSVRANNETAKSVALGTGLTFNNGTNTTATVGENGVVTYSLNDAISLTSVKTGSSLLDTSGLTITGGPSVTTSGIDAGSKKITGVANGENASDAVNKGQLDALQSQVSGGWNLSGTNSEGTAVTAQIGAGKTVTYNNGSYTKAVVTKDDSGNATVKVDVTTGKFGSGTGDKAGTVTSTANGLATTQNVADAINSASINVVADNTSGSKKAVKAGNTVHFANDGNLTLVQGDNTSGEATFTYGLNEEISISKVTTSDTTKGSTVQTAEGITTTDAAGNTYIQNGQGITLTPKTPEDGKTAVTLSNKGLSNGGNVISGVGAGTDDTDAVNVSQLKKVQDQVGSGWQIAGNDGTKVADIGAGKKVAFKSNSKYLTTTTVRSATGDSDTGADVTYSLKTKALVSGTNGTVASVSDADDGLATAKNVAETINQTYWTAASGKSGSGSQTDETANAADKQISAGDTVMFNAGNNLSLVQNGASFTYGLQTDLTGMNTIRFGGTLNNGNWSGGLLIGKQAGSGANTADGNYITGLSNTKWDRATVSENSSMAATEGQLKQAIENITTSGGGTGGFGLQADTGDSIMQDLRKTIQIKGDGEGTQDGNIKTSNEDGVLRIRLNKALNLSEDGSVQVGSSKMSNGAIQLGEDADPNKILMDSAKGMATVGDVTINGANKTVSGLSNTTWEAAKVTQDVSVGGYKGSTKAATESQLAAAISEATTTAAQNEQHIQSGNYDVGQGKSLDGKPIGKNSVAINVISGDGTKPGDVKGQVVINDVAKASDVGDTDKLSTEIKTKNGGNDQKTSVVEAVNNLNDKVNSRVGDNRYSAVTSKDLVQDGDSSTTAIAKLNNRMTDIYTTSTQHSSVSVDGNLTLDNSSKNTSGGTNYKIGLNKEKIDLGKVTIQGNDGSITAKSMTADTFTAGITVVSNDGVKVDDKSALTSDTLKVNGKTYVSGDGLNANSQKITNVAAGSADTDAVNVKQVNDLAARQGEAITENAAHIGELGRAVNKLDNRINRVGAGAAALATLHPGSYDPDDKLDVSAGVGNYRGANAAAVGLFFHPNERTILSVAGSMGGGENMVNAGVTLKVGPGHGTPTTVTTRTGQKVDVMDILAKQTEILEKLAGNAKAVSAPAGSDIFPDVPQNHWAYAYVDKLYRTGSLAGFSEPGKLKSHMLTRKDFAEILYWAMTNGATTNPDLNSDGSLNRLAAEFGAELKLVMR